MQAANDGFLMDSDEARKRELLTLPMFAQPVYLVDYWRVLPSTRRRHTNFTTGLSPVNILTP